MQTTEWTIMGFRFGIAGVYRLLILVVVAGCSDSGSRPAMPNNATSAKTGHEASTSQQTSDNEHPETSLRFDDVTSKTGIRFVNRNGEEAGQFAIVESLGGGVGVIDFDRDGNDDLLLPGGGNMAGDAEPIGLSCGLYRNRTAWQFDDVTAVSGTHEPTKYSHGCASCDFDNDGFPDAVVTGFGGLLFFRNLGDGTFEEVAASSGLNDHLWSSSAAWGDVTNDGLVDLYVAHYVNWSPTNNPFCPGPDESTREVCPPRDFEGLPDVFYVGQGDGTFSDKSSDFGLRPDGKGLGVLMADLDDDRDLDVYITNDTVPNVLYRNDNGKVFEDSSLISGASLSARGVPDGSMGVQLLDYDQNGRFDIWVANYERETSALYESQGNLLFRHVSQGSGVTAVGAMYV